MVRRSLTVRDIAEILMRWQAGRSLRQIAHSLGVDRNTVRKYVALATSLGYQPGPEELSLQEWCTVQQQHASQLVDPTSRSLIFEELARYHVAIAAGLKSNHASTVWRRLHAEQGLQASLRNFYRYVAAYFPEHAHQAQLTVRRDDPLPARRPRSTLAIWVCAPTPSAAKPASCGPSASS